ncbi:MAG TPA: ABC transporter permease [Candidatus Dormibacteraeota bacterium]|nr:ABC transporter permease [Candidatus Dormibacteraeota bacterium]
MTDVRNDPAATSGSGDLDTELMPELAAAAAEAVIPPEIVAQSMGQYLHGWWTRVRGGDSGILPVIGALLVLGVVFQIVSPGHVFLTADNFVNLLQQSAVYMVLAMAEVFVLLLGEIDLSIGFVGPLAAVIAVQLVQPATSNWAWWLAIPVALIAGAAWGAIQGTIITRLRLPSFIVTLAGLLIANGVMLFILLIGPFSGYPLLTGPSHNQTMLHNLMNASIDTAVSWVLMAVLVAATGIFMWLRDSRRRRHGLVAPPPSLTLLKVAFIAVVGVILVAICSVNRAINGNISGVPWFVFVVLAVLAFWTVLLERTRFGRYIYAIGGNPESARRAGVNLARVRTIAFALCSFTAAIAGLLYASRLDGMSNNVQGGQDTLYAVAAAVIGGTSLFGGRGRVLHGVLGGLVIGVIYNGLFLLGLDVKWQYIVTGFVLLASLTIDSLSRRGATTGVSTH